MLFERVLDLLRTRDVVKRQPKYPGDVVGVRGLYEIYH
jgi:hypothetical protein